MRLFRFVVPAVLLAGFLAACSFPFSDEQADLGLLNNQRVKAIIRPPPVALGLQQATAEFVAEESSSGIPKISPQLVLTKLSVPIELSAQVTAGSDSTDLTSVTLPEEITLSDFTFSFTVTDGESSDSASFSSVSIPGTVTLERGSGSSYSFSVAPEPLDLVVAGELMAGVNGIVIGPDSETFNLDITLNFTADVDAATLPADFSLTFTVSDGTATISGRAKL